MPNRTAILCLAAVLMLPAAATFASDEAAKLTDETTQSIRAKLTDQGYAVGKIKAEDGLYEAYARKDGQRLEVYLNSELEIVRTKVDD